MFSIITGWCCHIHYCIPYDEKADKKPKKKPNWTVATLSHMGFCCSGVHKLLFYSAASQMACLTASPQGIWEAFLSEEMLKCVPGALGWVCSPTPLYAGVSCVVNIHFVLLVAKWLLNLWLRYSPLQFVWNLLKLLTLSWVFAHTSQSVQASNASSFIWSNSMWVHHVWSSVNNT